MKDGIDLGDYRAPWWLPGGHAQTIWPITHAQALPAYRRERWDTPDSDFVDLDWLPTAKADAALVVLFHGLEGSSHSHYARALMAATARRGWRGVVVNFRGCSGMPNRLARAYHSGDSAEIDWILRRLQTIAGCAPMFAVGVSLGGNALLKWLGEREQDATRVLSAAAAVCAPLDLTISGTALGQGFNRVYTLHFLRTLKAKALAKCAAHPGCFDAAHIAQARTLAEFDDAYTAPAHGFNGVADYWCRASARPWLRAIHCPTLVLNAANDPFVPAAALPQVTDLAPAVHFAHPAEGGHVGFCTGAWPGEQTWLAQGLLAHFDSHH